MTIHDLLSLARDVLASPTPLASKAGEA